MAWIESHQELRNHPKVYRLMEALNIEKPAAIGFLHLFWWWCVDYAPTGRLDGYNDIQIARAAEWSGEPKAFVVALIEARLLDRQEGVLTVHDWSEFRLHADLLRERKDRKKRQIRARVERWRKKRIGNAAVTLCNAATVPKRPNIPNLTKQTKPEKPKPPPSAEAQKLAHRLRELILGNDPGAKISEAQVTAWVSDADLLLRRDQRRPEEALRVLEWCQGDSFWRANILSFGKFRKQYGQLKLKMGAQHGTNRGSDPAAPEKVRNGGTDYGDAFRRASMRSVQKG